MLSRIPGQPVMRPLWFEFPEDADHFGTEDQFMLGVALLVAPVMVEGATQRSVYLPPASVWYDAATGEPNPYCPLQLVQSGKQCSLRTPVADLARKLT